MTVILNSSFVLILLCVSLNTFAQVLMKRGLNRLGVLEFQWSDLLTTIFKVAQNPFIVSGIFCFVLSLGLWLMALSRLELSVAYPMLSISYILTALLGYWFLGENLSTLRVFGIVVIMFGVYLVSRP